MQVETGVRVAMEVAGPNQKQFPSVFRRTQRIETASKWTFKQGWGPPEKGEELLGKQCFGPSVPLGGSRWCQSSCGFFTHSLAESLHARERWV